VTALGPAKLMLGAWPAGGPRSVGGRLLHDDEAERLLLQVVPRRRASTH